MELPHTESNKPKRKMLALNKGPIYYVPVFHSINQTFLHFLYKAETCFSNWPENNLSIQ